MEHIFRKIVSFSLLAGTCALQADCSSGSCSVGGSSSGSSGSIHSVTPTIVVRSPGANAVRRMVHSVGHLNKADMDKIYGTAAVTVEYTRSFNSSDLADCLFGSCALNVQGSAVANRDANALLADYFYLPRDFSSTISIEPTIQTALADFFGFVGFDEWVSGLYAWVQFPVAWSKWNLDFCESVVSTGTLSHQAGYFTPGVLQRSALLGNATEFFKGNAPSAVTQSNGTIGTNRTVTFNGLSCSKICSGDSTKTTVPEVRFALGWNFLLDEDYHLGVNIQASGPTGNKPDHDFLFSVQNSNGKHWELGGAVGGHVILWRSDDEEKNFGFYVDANFTHLFKSCQKRCFDLCNKPLSRYMLAEKMTPVANIPAADLVAGGATIVTTTTATYQFSGEFAPVANLTDFDLNVSVGTQVDLVAMFNYTHKGWNWDLGYNFWYRSCEKLNTKCDSFPENTWALKGDSQVFGFDTGSAGTAAVANTLPLSATQSGATITSGLNAGQSNALNNPKVNNPQLAFAATNGNPLNALPGGGALSQVNTSIQPVFISQSDVNFARNKGMTHKVFSDLGYTWDREDYIPYLGVGFEAEFAAGHNDCGDCESECGSCDNDCDNNTNGNCLQCSLSQWGIWIKGGVSFN